MGLEAFFSRRKRAIASAEKAIGHFQTGGTDKNEKFLDAYNAVPTKGRHRDIYQAMNRQLAHMSAGENWENTERFAGEAKLTQGELLQLRSQNFDAAADVLEDGPAKEAIRAKARGAEERGRQLRSQGK